MNHKFNLFHLSYFFAIIIFMVIVISIPVFKINTSQFHLAIAQQQQQSSQANQISFIIKEDPSSLQGSFFNIDNRTFSHHMTSVNGIQMHYVIGGKGDPLVLLHGFPQSWYEWRHVMPALAKNYTVIVLDLRGFGDTSKPDTGLRW
jgi:hypothetical protein